MNCPSQRQHYLNLCEIGLRLKESIQLLSVLESALVSELISIRDGSLPVQPEETYSHRQEVLEDSV